MHVEEHKSEAKYRNEQQKKKFCSSTTGDWDGVVVILWLDTYAIIPIITTIININTGESRAASLQAPLAARQAQAVLDPPASNSNQIPRMDPILDPPASNSNQTLSPPNHSL